MRTKGLLGDSNCSKIIRAWITILLQAELLSSWLNFNNEMEQGWKTGWKHRACKHSLVSSRGAFASRKEVNGCFSSLYLWLLYPSCRHSKYAWNIMKLHALLPPFPKKSKNDTEFCFWRQTPMNLSWPTPQFSGPRWSQMLLDGPLRIRSLLQAESLVLGYRLSNALHRYCVGRVGLPTLLSCNATLDIYTWLKPNGQVGDSKWQGKMKLFCCELIGQKTPWSTFRNRC